MVLYTEKQLEDCYQEYRRMQIRRDMSFVTLEEFRELVEDIMHILYKDLL